jgi:hypothetical protein
MNIKRFLLTVCYAGKISANGNFDTMEEARSAMIEDFKKSGYTDEEVEDIINNNDETEDTAILEDEAWAPCVGIEHRECTWQIIDLAKIN